MAPVFHAPGWPGIPPRWTSSAKQGVGTALGTASRVWFTVSHGILNEVYYPRMDQACIRDLGLLVAGEGGFFSEEKRDCQHSVFQLADGVPGYRLVNTCLEGRYRVEKEVLADPRRDCVLQSVQFVPLQGALGDYQVCALLAPHLGNRGAGNTAWVGDYKGMPMLFAERDGTALALASSAAWSARSVGFVGVSDGWRDVRENGRLSWGYTRAENGNVALAGAVDLAAKGGTFLLALGFGRTAAEAGHRARASLLGEFEDAKRRYVDQWLAWQQQVRPVADRSHAYRVSAAVLRTHEAKRFPGGLIASLSIPWGFARGDDDLGGYHLAWPRDLVESAEALLAAGAHEDVRRVLRYLQATQGADGSWPQNMWLDGTPYWGGVQMDETAFPILLADMARREGAIDSAGEARLWPMVRRAAAFLVASGPVTQEDRWEEDPGYSPFTLAVEIAALLAAAELAERNGEGAAAVYLRETADAWAGSIDDWTYATGTELARRVGVEGYYVRIAPPEEAEAASPAQGFVPIKNRPPGENVENASQVVSTDALALVRFGLRAADDPRITNTVRVIDALLRVDTPFGPAWRRYNDDGYGEHPDGSPFDGTGVGRAWPLLTGERAHFELAAGRLETAGELLRTMEAFAGDGGLLSEQVWDASDLPDRGLSLGRPSGSAMPLVWAHAEHVKLLRSLGDGRVFDTPPQTVQRYLAATPPAFRALWRFNQKRRWIGPGQTLRVETLFPAVVHWSPDGWQTVRDTPTRDGGLGIHLADLETSHLAAGEEVVFTFRWPEADRWEGVDFRVEVRASEPRAV